MGATDTEVQKSILDAMRLVVTGEIADNINAPVVVKGEVLEILDESNHQYKILYNNNTYDDVYAIANTQYSISTIVYVLIPEGDYSDKKWILGSVQPDADSFVTESKYDIYTTISPNLLDQIEGYYDDSHKIEEKKWHEEIHLKSWMDEEIPLNIKTGYQNFAKTFKDYLVNYKTFVFSALIKTDIDINYQKQGDYGLKMIIPTVNTKLQKDNKQPFEIFMTTYQMQGDPYNYDLFQRVNVYFSLNEEWTYNTDDLSGFSFNFFTKGFEYSPEDIKVIEDAIQKEERLPYDIIIKDISLKIIDEIPEEKRNGRYLKLVSSDGNYFLSGGYATKKILTPILKINSKETNLKGWDCYWFVEDYSIETNSEDYLKIDGISNIGWKCLNEKTNEKQYIKDKYFLEVKPSDVAVEARYRCILTRTVTKSDNNQETVIVFDDISLKNLDSRISLSLSTVTGSNIFAENIGNVDLVARIETDEKIFDKDKDNFGYDIVWKRFDKSNNAIDEDIFYTVTKPLSYISDRTISISSNPKDDIKLYTYETIISYPCKILDMSNTVYCTFYKNAANNTKVNLGSRLILITTRKEVGYTLKIVNGDVLYKYNSDGDSPMVSDYDGPISSRISSTKPFSYQIFKPDGYELSENEYNYVYCKWYIPKKSLIELTDASSASTWIDENGQSYYILENIEQINYNIAQQYNKEKANNNNIKLEVKYDGNSIVQTAYPKFIKDGEGGTNGSKYTAIIKYKYSPDKESAAYGEMDGNICRKLHMVWVNKEKGSTSTSKVGWYYHNQDTGFLEPLPDEGLLLEVALWENGIQSYKTVTRSWSIYDDKDIKKKNCFTIENSTSETCRFKKLKSPDSNWTKPKDEIPWTIVQCEITVTDENATKGISNQQIVRAYYPIEVTFLKEYDFDTKSNPNPRMLPTLRGGFDEVLYNMDGRNPEYDQEKIYIEDNASFNNQYNFVCENDIEGLQTHIEGFTQEYNYIWTCSNENLSIDKTSEGKDKDGNYIGKYAAINPKSRFETGVGFNYIRVEYTWDMASRNPILAEIAKLKTQIENAEKKRAWYIGTFKEAENGHYYRKEYENKSGIKDYKYFYDEEAHSPYEISINGNRQYINSLYNEWYNYDEWVNNYLLDQNKTEKRSQSFLEYINRGLLILDKILNLLNGIENFCISQGLNSDDIKNIYGENFSEMKNKIISARIALYFLGVHSDDTLENLIPLYGYDPGTASYINDKLSPNTNMVPAGKKQKSIIEQLQFYSILWDTEVINYNKCYQELVKPENNNTTIKYYQAAFNHLYNFKHILDGIWINDIEKIQGNFVYEKEKEDQPYELPLVKKLKAKEDRSNFYLDSDIDDPPPEIDTFFIDNFKDKINFLREVITPPENIIPSDSSKRLYSISDYKCNFIDQVLNAIKYIYTELGSYMEDEKYQDIFYEYLEEHRLRKRTYETLLSDEGINTESIHIKPILMHTNTTGLGYINQWDGNRLYIDEDGGRYIMAPIMGAGKKEGGYFTGVVMGLREDNKKSDTLGYEPPRIGLHGFSHGDTSFFLNAEDGSAILGKNDNGQMIIDPSNNMGLIYNANYFSPNECPASGQGKPTKYDKIEDSKVGGYERKGMLIKFTEERNEQGQIVSSPFIHFAQADQGKIYSGDHKSIKAGNEGFYLSHDGLSIGTGFIVYAKAENNHLTGEAHFEQLGSTLSGWKVVKHKHINEETGLPVEDVGLISGSLGENNTGSGIFMDSETSTIVLGSTGGRIYSGAHYNKESKKDGFYLGKDGLSIGSLFKVDIQGTPKIILGDSKHTDAFICSGKHTKIDSTNSGFFLSKDGFSIVGEYPDPDNEDNKIKSKFMIKTDGNPVIYSGGHSTLGSLVEGFYIGNNGLSIGNSIRISSANNGKVEIGKLNNNANHWTIDGDTSQAHVPKHPLEIYEENAKKPSKFKQGYKEGEKFLLLKSEDDQNGLVYEMTGYEVIDVSTGKHYTVTSVKKGDVISPGVNCNIVGDGSGGYNNYSYSYIAYNTHELKVTPISKFDILMDEDYNTLTFDEGTRNNQVYLGTNGLRIGKCFAVDNEGDGIFKGNIEAEHGFIGGWKISEDGLYYSDDKDRTKEDCEVIKPDQSKYKKDIKYQKVFLVNIKGEIGVSYFYRGDDTFIACYQDGDDRWVSNTITTNTRIPTPLALKWFGEKGWHGFNSGAFDVRANGSHFGAVFIKGDRTYYEGLFHADAIKEIENYAAAKILVDIDDSDSAIRTALNKYYVVTGN